MHCHTSQRRAYDLGILSSASIPWKSVPCIAGQAWISILGEPTSSSRDGRIRMLLHFKQHLYIIKHVIACMGTEMTMNNLRCRAGLEEILGAAASTSWQSLIRMPSDLSAASLSNLDFAHAKLPSPSLENSQSLPEEETFMFEANAMPFDMDAPAQPPASPRSNRYGLMALAAFTTQMWSLRVS